MEPPSRGFEIANDRATSQNPRNNPCSFGNAHVEDRNSVSDPVEASLGVISGGALVVAGIVLIATSG